MEIILQRICSGMVDSILNLLETGSLSNIMKLSTEIKDITSKSALEILKSVIEMTDQVLLENRKLRHEDRLQVQERDVPRTVETSLGELSFKRTYYCVREPSGKNRYVYLIDHVIGLEAYERITKDLVAQILTDTAEVSYRTAVRRQDSSISAQTVHNRLVASKTCAAEVKKADQTPSVLDLFVDEGHVHMRDGKTAIVPLIAVTEGIDREKKRHKTIRPFFMEGYGISTGAFRENLLSVMTERYDLDAVEKIRLHCDGGNWIKGIASVLPNVTVYMDEFHIEKYMKSLQNRTDDPQKKKALRDSLEKNDYESFFTAGTEITQKLDKKGSEKVHRILKYFQNNWDTIQNRKQADGVCGSCTEGLVGNLLSSRLSRHPMGWSSEGLRKMAALRIYWKNGNQMKPDNVRISCKGRNTSEEQAAFLSEGFDRYADYAEKQTKEFLQRRYDWSLFDPVPDRTGKLTGTQVLLNALGSIHDTLASA